ncbi:MAG: hypothetical protein ABIW02_03260 [Nitrosospira sp.]|nr:hypothetical protein [Nitrosospira sp.]
MSIKPSGKTGVGSKKNKLVEHEVVSERRNHYQKISAASYYRTERRGGHGQDWLEAKTEMDDVPV